MFLIQAVLLLLLALCKLPQPNASRLLSVREWLESQKKDTEKKKQSQKEALFNTSGATPTLKESTWQHGSGSEKASPNASNASEQLGMSSFPCDCGWCQGDKGDMSTVLVTELIKSKGKDNLPRDGKYHYYYPLPMELAGEYNNCGTLLGVGKFGFVLDVQRKGTNLPRVVVKVQKLSPQAENELNMLTKFKGKPRIVQLLGAGVHYEQVSRTVKVVNMETWKVETTTRINPVPYMVLVLEKADSDLQSCISSAVSPRAKLWLFKDMLEGLKAMHRQSVVFRDLKPDNVLLFGDTCETGTAKLSDFGMACDFGCWAKKRPAECKRLGGAPFYRAPELLKQINITDSNTYRDQEQLKNIKIKASITNDMWAAGVMLHEFVFDGQKPEQLIPGEGLEAKIIEMQPMPEYCAAAMPPSWDVDPEGVYKLLVGLLQPIAKNRPCASKALHLVNKALGLPRKHFWQF